MNGLTEDGSEVYKKEKREESIKVWKLRRLKVLYSLTRCAVSLKVRQNVNLDTKFVIQGHGKSFCIKVYVAGQLITERKCCSTNDDLKINSCLY